MWMSRWLAQLERFTTKRWYLPLISILAGLDMFLVLFPTDILVVSTSIVHRSRPRSWIKIALSVTTGSALGALALAWATQEWGPRVFRSIALVGPSSQTWATAETLIQKHGRWALVLMAAGPLPAQPGVILASAAKVAMTPIFVSVWLGRWIKYAFLAWSRSQSSASAELGVEKTPEVAA